MVNYKQALSNANQITESGAPYSDIAEFVIDSRLSAAMVGFVPSIRIDSSELICMQEHQKGIDMWEKYRKEGWNVNFEGRADGWTLIFRELNVEINPF